MEKILESFTIKNLTIYLLPLIYAILIVVIGHFLCKYFINLLVKFMRKSKADELLVGLLKKILYIVGHFIIVLSALSKLGVSTTGLLAALTAVTAGVALALKDSLSNIAGGIVLIVSPRFVAGDLINVVGYEGRVIEVGLMHTTILTYNKESVSIPNGVLVNSQISNLTSEKIRRVDIRFPLPYGTDTAFAKKTALDIIPTSKFTMTDDEHFPTIRIESYMDSSVTMFVRAWCYAENYWNCFYDLNELLLNGMEKKGISIPFNRLDVSINDTKSEENK